MFRTLIAGSFFALTLALSAFADTPTAERPAAAQPDRPACSTLTLNLNEPARVGDIDKYAKCVYNCLRRGGGADYCAQSCAGLLQNLQEEKRRPGSEDFSTTLTSD
jgi:hypothetical protein